jgi:hypothetical protein
VRAARAAPAGLRRRAETREFLVIGDGIAFANEEIGDLGAFLVGADDRLPARHDESGHAHQIGEAGIGGFCDHDQGLARRFLFLGLRAVFPPVISGREYDKEHDTQHTLEIFGERHR